tara:strand:+ start:82570 stop:82797 length:228 start_codon:yes stop_codon:yes gene_type:complete
MKQERDILSEIDNIIETERKQGNIVDQTEVGDIIKQLEKLSYNELKLIEVRLINLKNSKKPDVKKGQDEPPTFSL